MANAYQLSSSERSRAAKIWHRRGRDGFTVLRSAEGALSTTESVRELYPADMEWPDLVEAIPPQYSYAVPVFEWVAHRLAAVDEWQRRGLA